MPGMGLVCRTVLLGSYLEGHTRGLPPSPLQVSLPLTPPAQMKESWSLYFCPSLVQIHSLWLTRVTTLLFQGLLMKNSTHVRPLSKLGLRLGESLDSYTKTILVPSSTTRCVLDLGRWRRDEVRILAANIQEARALAVLRCQASEPIPDVKQLSVVGAVLEICIHFNSCFVHNLLCRFRNIIIWITIVLFDHLNKNINIITELASLLLCAVSIIYLLSLCSKYFCNCFQAASIKSSCL